MKKEEDMKIIRHSIQKNIVSAIIHLMVSCFVLSLIIACYPSYIDANGRKYFVRDSMPNDNLKGYADFSWTEKTDLPGIVGIKWKGDGGGNEAWPTAPYYPRYVRISAAPGKQEFIMHIISPTGSGPSYFRTITLDIVKGMSTPVELTSVRTDSGGLFSSSRVYEISWNIRPPAPTTSIVNK